MTTSSRQAALINGSASHALDYDDVNMACTGHPSVVLIPALLALAESRGADTQARYDAHTQAAMDAGVFGAPTYVIDGELFWGQDRLDFVARKLGIV